MFILLFNKVYLPSSLDNVESCINVYVVGVVSSVRSHSNNNKTKGIRPVCFIFNLNFSISNPQLSTGDTFIESSD